MTEKLGISGRLAAFFLDHFAGIEEGLARMAGVLAAAAWAGPAQSSAASSSRR